MLKALAEDCLGALDFAAINFEEREEGACGTRAIVLANEFDKREVRAGGVAGGVLSESQKVTLLGCGLPQLREMIDGALGGILPQGADGGEFEELRVGGRVGKALGDECLGFIDGALLDGVGGASMHCASGSVVGGTLTSGFESLGFLPGVGPLGEAEQGAECDAQA